MQGKPTTSQTWRPWQLWVACTVAFAASGLLIIADGLAAVMGSWDTPAPGLGWIKVGLAGHCFLAGASVGVLVAGIQRSRWRRAAVIAAWLIVPIGLAWFVLTGRLVVGG